MWPNRQTYELIRFLVYGAFLTAILTSGNVAEIIEGAERAVWKAYLEARRAELRQIQADLDRWADDGGSQA